METLELEIMLWELMDFIHESHQKQLHLLSFTRRRDHTVIVEIGGELEYITQFLSYWRKYHRAGRQQ